ncbi:hypothetical protein ABZ312_38800 [Streptomyces sp. NPDC006207]
MVTGPAGAGKTVFALALILALLKTRADTDPVPVRIPVSLWDTTTPLETLLTQRLIEAYGWPTTQAAALVEHGMILPVLDGLDEMDPTLPDGTPDPDAPRARAALSHLDRYRVRGEPGPVVLTCRTAHLHALTTRGTLRDSAQITLAPVTPAHAITYLTTRAQDMSRWQPLIDHLTGHPTGALATLLSTPWRLCLTATVYHHDGNPPELTTHATAQALDEHLLARFIPAATRLRPHPRSSFGRQRTYHPDQVHRWLHHLTHALTPTTTGPATTPVPVGAGTDLVLHQLWPLAGRTRVRILDAVLAVSAVLLTLPLARTTTVPTLMASMIVLIAVWAALSAATARPEPPGRLRLSRPAIPSRTLGVGLKGGLAFGLPAGLGFGLPAGQAFGLPAGQAFGLMGGLVVGLVVALVVGLVVGLVVALMVMLRSGLQAPPAKEARPWGLLRDDLVVQWVTGLVTGLVVGLVVGLVGALASGVEVGLAGWLASGLVVGLALGLAGGQGDVVVRRYAVFLLCSRGRLPFRLVVFLDWACEAGLLRYAGPAYQFRHRELQQWLTTHPGPTTLPGP